MAEKLGSGLQNRVHRCESGSRLQEFMKKKDRFAELEKEKKLWLSHLSMRKAIALEESLLSSSLVWEWRKNFFPDRPVCLKNIIKQKA